MKTHSPQARISTTSSGYNSDHSAGGQSPGQSPGTSPRRERDRVPYTGERRPGETAFFLAKPADEGERYRFLGVGRWSEEAGAWTLAGPR